MKFREYGNLKPMVLTADNDRALEQAIERIGIQHNIIDLQFSTDIIRDIIKGQVIMYHALLLIEEEANNEVTQAN